MPPTAVRRAEFDEVYSALNNHLTDCAKENRTTRETLKVLSEGLEALEDLVRGFKRLAWRGFVGLVGTVVTVGATILLQSWLKG